MERPKKPLSAFFIWSKTERSELVKNNPEARMSEIVKLLSQKWIGLDQETKDKYTALSNESRSKYEQEKAAYDRLQANAIVNPHHISANQPELDDYDAY
jgi:hypothetical protein